MRTSTSYHPTAEASTPHAMAYSCLICGTELLAIPGSNDGGACTCGNVQLDSKTNRLSLRDEAQLEASRIVDVRHGFVSKIVKLDSPLGHLLLGVVNPDVEGVADSVSWLLFRSIRDALGSLGGHLPDWLVDDIRRNYISPEKIRTLWAPFGHRFALVRSDTGEMVGTIHIARSHRTILTVNRDINNVLDKDYPGFKPEGGHHVVNISVQHEIRRAHLGRLMVNGILQHFLDLFDGNALWVRADPPWHSGLRGLGFDHDPSMDIFLPAIVERTRDLSHSRFNALYACDCVCPNPAKPEFLKLRPSLLQTEKLQYVSMMRPFVTEPKVSIGPFGSSTSIANNQEIDRAFTRDWGQTITRLPQSVVAPRSTKEASDLLAQASAEKKPVTIRGMGRSAGGQALSDGGTLLLTSHFDSIIFEEDRVNVGGGVRWDELLRQTLPRGLVPPVVPGFLSTTLGGTLSSGGFSKGSITQGMLFDHVLELEVMTGDGRRVLCGPTQAAWLFDSVLGGLGRFGVITRATLALRKAPRNIVTRTIECSHEIDSLLDRFTEFSQHFDSFHATVFVASNGSTLTHKAVLARLTDENDGMPLERYLMPARPQSPASPSCWAHVFAPPSAVATLLDRARALIAFDRGDTLQWLPCLKKATGKSLVRTANVPRNTLHYAIMMNRSATDATQETIDAENREWIASAISLGAKNALGGALPQSTEEWQKHLGNDYDDVKTRAILADPAGILGVWSF